MLLWPFLQAMRRGERLNLSPLSRLSLGTLFIRSSTILKFPLVAASINGVYLSNPAA